MRAHTVALLVGLALLLGGCGVGGGQGLRPSAAPSPSWTLSPTPSGKGAGTPRPMAPAAPTPSPTGAPSPVPPSPQARKPGPPPGYTPLPPEPTPTVPVTVPAEDWQEITLPPPEGIEMVEPESGDVPTVHMRIPKEWSFVNHPGAYFLGPEPRSGLPILVAGPYYGIQDWQEPRPRNMDEFAEVIVRVYRQVYRVSRIRVERVPVGGLEGVAIYPLDLETVCMDLYVWLPTQPDVAYQFTFSPPLCTPKNVLTETGRAILESIRLEQE
ncbi:MAG: hypothetical protein Q9O62_13945 [Ardenticatenia bacterium]|nr:hypothetical protein [Ardenticatenia bacterium]